MGDKRKHDRMFAALEIKVMWPGKETLIASTHNFSDAGAFVSVRLEPQPPVGTEMFLQLNALVNGSPAPVLRAKVIRAQSDGVAFEFVRDNL